MLVRRRFVVETTDSPVRAASRTDTERRCSLAGSANGSRLPAPIDEEPHPDSGHVPSKAESTLLTERVPEVVEGREPTAADAGCVSGRPMDAVTRRLPPVRLESAGTPMSTRRRETRYYPPGRRNRRAHSPRRITRHPRRSASFRTHGARTTGLTAKRRAHDALVARVRRLRGLLDPRTSRGGTDVNRPYDCADRPRGTPQAAGSRKPSRRVLTRSGTFWRHSLAGSTSLKPNPGPPREDAGTVH